MLNFNPYVDKGTEVHCIYLNNNTLLMLSNHETMPALLGSYVTDVP